MCLAVVHYFSDNDDDYYIIKVIFACILFPYSILLISVTTKALQSYKIGVTITAFDLPLASKISIYDILLQHC